MQMTTEADEHEHNRIFAIDRILGSVERFLIKENSVLGMNICTGKSTHRKSAKMLTLINGKNR